MLIKKNSKKPIKQILTLLLAVAISITTLLNTINVYADDKVSGPGTGGGQGSAGASSDYKAWSS